MNPLNHLSLYDSLVKLCVGILLLGWLPFVFDLQLAAENLYSKKIIAGLLIVIYSYVIGNVWHHWVTEKLFKRWRNREKDIEKAYTKVHNTKDKNLIFDTNKNPNDYYLAYYRIEKDGLLGNIPILEALEAFMRNTLIIIPFYCLWLSFEIINNCGMLNCYFMVIGIVILTLSALGWDCLWRKIQSKIHELVWEADLYDKKLKEEKDK